ncbi:YitT family protein [Bacillus sp. J33]|uniref:YitT family protein n=1 Tax=Bacillus sp. J33 TaxID=935836 RepID=UPI0009FD656D
MGVGIGLGVVFRAGGNTGGFTLIAQILQKIKSVKYSTSIMFMDATVMIAGALIFSPEKALYALVGAFVVDVKLNFTLFARFLFTLLLKKCFSGFSCDDFPRFHLHG